MIKSLCTKVKRFYLQMIRGYGWLSDSTWFIHLFFLLCLFVFMLSAWRTERAVCYMLHVPHSIGIVYVLYGLCGLVLMVHESDYPWQREWVRIPVGLLSVFIMYNCLFSLVWLFIVSIFALPAGVECCGTVVLLIYTCLIVYIGFRNAKTVRTVSCSVSVAGLQKPYRIGLISDLHLGTYVDSKHVQRIVNAINEIQPDLVIIAGDLIDNACSFSWNEGEVAQVAGLLRKIQSPEGTVLTLGNHDPAVPDEHFLPFLRESNIRLLHNEVAEYPDFYVVGRTDPSQNGREPIEKLMAGCAKPKPRIIVDHDPQYIDEAISCGAELVLSGHTHAGQFFPASTAVKLVLGKEKFYGHHTIENTHCIVSSGAGVFNLPVRIGTHNEIVDITLEPSSADR